MRRDDKYRFSLGWGRDTAEKIAVGDFLEKLKNRKSDLIVQAVWEYIGNHPEVMAENAKIVITVRSTPTDEQTFAKIQSMIDAALESLKDNMKYQIEQENRSGQEEPTGPNQQDLDDMLDLGHVNIYMFEGGTNFGFMNGSNYYDQITPDVTSYDYDALLTEAGDITPKYEAFQKVISKYAPIPEVNLSTPIRKKAYGELTSTAKVGLFETLEDISSPIVDTFPVCMEKCGQNYGYILYHSPLSKEKNIERIRLWGANDRAKLYVDHKPLTTLYDRQLLGEYSVQLDQVVMAEDMNAMKSETPVFKQEPVTFEPGAPLDILMENMGRVNFGPMMEHQHKGIKDCVQINGHMHYNWTMYPLPLENVDKIDFTKGYIEGLPAFYRFEMEVTERADTFLELDGWGKGCVFLNGFNLGRFWEIGPQKRLYIPAPLLKEGRNEIIVFETEGKSTGKIALKDEPDIG